MVTNIQVLYVMRLSTEELSIAGGTYMATQTCFKSVTYSEFDGSVNKSGDIPSGLKNSLYIKVKSTVN